MSDLLFVAIYTIQIFICVYAVVDRICQCCEKCAWMNNGSPMAKEVLDRVKGGKENDN